MLTKNLSFKFAYGHMTVSNLLWVFPQVNNTHMQNDGEKGKSLWQGGLITSFLGPAQLSIAISTEKRERAWYLLSCE